MKEKIKDGIVGLVVADAIGVPVEFESRESLKKHPVTDMIGYGTHYQPEGTWSDDSSMVIATMDSIVQKETIDYDDIMHKFYEWKKDSKYTATGDFFDIGITTNNAIKKYASGVPSLMCGETNEHSNGNGSLMRILPAVLYCYYNGLSNDEEVEIINSVSSLTHAHNISKLGCKIYSDFIKELLNGNSPLEAYNSLSNNNYEEYYDRNSISKYNRIFDGSLKNANVNEIQSSGFVVHTLEASIWTILNSKSYKEAVLKSVNLGEDTDTVAAVTGSMAGIIYGVENIPEKWLNNLKSNKYLFDLCEQFSETLCAQDIRQF